MCLCVCVSVCVREFDHQYLFITGQTSGGVWMCVWVCFWGNEYLLLCRNHCLDIIWKPALSLFTLFIKPLTPSFCLDVICLLSFFLVTLFLSLHSGTFAQAGSSLQFLGRQKIAITSLMLPIWVLLSVSFLSSCWCQCDAVFGTWAKNRLLVQSYVCMTE